ncbi:MAG TPA: hypothetical protein VLL48_07555, partial [Longimicrobiales bacterium]|nr:hypothetical protein [Longimicrobiales bacterium]
RDQIALLESNDPEVVSRLAFSGLVTYSVLSGAVTGICLADPKACFGSCPTFYGDDPHRPLAEGFSRSWARALEDRDLDDLRLRAPSGPFSLLMRNEALETHAVRTARLLAVPVDEGAGVAADRAGRLWVLRKATAPVACLSPDGDCLSTVRHQDDREYAPFTNGEDLGAREEVELTFPALEGPVGVVLAARQSLVSTFLFYQALAYAGNETGELLAALERREPWALSGATALSSALGDIEVFVREREDAPWSRVGTFDEAGPIATDTRVLPLTARGGPLRLKLRMARGSWRVDRVAMARIEPAPEPVVVLPDSVIDEGGSSRSAEALRQLSDPEAHLVTTPGSAFRLWFTLPEGPDGYALFLESEGFYYEWMRETWTLEEDAGAASLMMLAPRQALRVLAPEFKRVEPEMERLFWSSRFRR